MLVKKTEHKEEDGSIGWVECIFDSSNILYTYYMFESKRLYIAFNRGGVYQYDNINKELYEQFENSDSQGKFLVKNIKNNKDYPYMKKFTAFEHEINDAKKIITEWKANQQQKNS